MVSKVVRMAMKVKMVSMVVMAVMGMMLTTMRIDITFPM